MCTYLLNFTLSEKKLLFIHRYLRKAFFPKHHDLQFAGRCCTAFLSMLKITVTLCSINLAVLFVCISGLLNPLDSPHHMRIDEEAKFREGVVVDRPCKMGKGSFVNCGMRKVCV